MTKTMKIGNETFEICKDNSCGDLSAYEVDYDAISKAYRKPSWNKVRIWGNWCRWAVENDAKIRISGHGSHFFSIEGNIKIDGQRYGLWITASHNRIARVA